MSNITHSSLFVRLEKIFMYKGAEKDSFVDRIEIAIFRSHPVESHWKVFLNIFSLV